MSTIILPTNWQQHQADLTKIRTDVFMHEQQVCAANEWDGLDEHAIHFLAFSADGNPIGCARLLCETAAENNHYHIGRVAISKPFRNQGVGRQLMQSVIAYCEKNAPYNRIYLHAQTERRSFYEALGFKAQGKEFMDAGIPHISMHFAQ